jgi:dipeptidyl aminopeptidase/acylaminoacyl peptidase
MFAIRRVSLVLMLAAVVSRISAGQQKRREPLPLDVAVSLANHNSRSSFDLSPDGAWLGQTYARGERVASDGPCFSPTGFPLAEGDLRMQVILTNTSTGEVIRLGGGSGESWAPVWSPDGKRVAFYTDDDGQVGVWIWEMATGKAKRFRGVVARPFFGFEVVRWTADSRRLLCKVLPAGMSVAEANALIPRTEEGRRFASVGPDQPSVFVLKSEARKASDRKADPPTPNVQASTFANRSLADLAILDLASGKVIRIAERVKPLWYAFSPDEKYIAYSDLQGFVPNTQQAVYALKLYEVASRQTKVLKEGVYLVYGIEVNWSPDGRHLAYISSGQLAKGEVNVVSIPDGARKNLGSDTIPSFDPGDGESPPLWDRAGGAVFGVGRDGKLWRIDVATGAGTLVGEVPGSTIQSIVTRPEFPTIWLTDGGQAVWVTTRETAGDRAGIFRIELSSGKRQAALLEPKSLSGVFNLDASDATGTIVYVAQDQQHLPDAWKLDSKTLRTDQVSHLNAGLEAFELGNARLIEYRGMNGQRLKSALLLPPGYQTGHRLPLVAWVYGGSIGSNYVNSFGSWGDIPMFNMHILATRGYGVLFPDTPLGPGTAMKDLYETVMPAVNAAIEQGYADPDRLAVTGQSYGSYSSLALIAQTKRFKAAIITAAAIHPDLFAAYLEMSSDGSAGSIGYYEQGQGNMGGNIWERRDRYLDNSPIFSFDQIETPVLIGQGEKDGRLIASDAIFVGLRRLGKEVEYRIYEGEGHVLTRKANVLDFWKRRLDFLDRQLKLAHDANGLVVPAPDRPVPEP